MFNKNFWLAMLPFGLLIVGNDFKNKDHNTAGKDDLFGDLLKLTGEAASAVQESQPDRLHKAIALINKVSGDWLKQNPAPAK